MSLYVIYHDTDHKDFKWIPLEKFCKALFEEGECRIKTDKSNDLRNAVRSCGSCLFILGIGRPKRYYLWAHFQFRYRIDPRHAGGTGFLLNPPQRLEGANFEEFKRAYGNMAFGLQQVQNLPFAYTLLDSAYRFRKPRLTRETLKFCEQFISVCKYDPNLLDQAVELHERVKRALAKRTTKKRKVPAAPRKGRSSPMRRTRKVPSRKKR